MTSRQLTIKQIIDRLHETEQMIDHSFGDLKINNELLERSFVLDVSTDSRKVAQDHVFIAISGQKVDGFHYLYDACKKGAILVITEKKPDFSCPFIIVHSARAAWAHLESLRHGDPQNQLKIIGVTGTNGKSSTVWMISHLLESLGEKTLMLGTLGSKLGGEMLPSIHTTPDPDILYSFLEKAVKNKARYVAMEVSSHALSQDKVLPLQFDVAVFTSFSRDHLDFHKDMSDYFKAKMKLFHQTKPGAYRLVHRDLITEFEHEKVFEHIPRHSFSFYGLSKNNGAAKLEGRVLSLTEDLKDSIKDSIKGFVRDSKPSIKSIEATTPFIGELANTNLLAAVMVVSQILDRGTEDFIVPIENLPQVPGRFEWVGQTFSGAEVFVDYAHTPDALDKASESLKMSFPSRNLVIVFGCGGDRDRGKRPLMAEVCFKHASQIIVTSDNPRSEDPNQILDDIYKGFPQSAFVTRELDREKAIAFAIKNLKANDVLLIAGKGHETYQLIGEKKIFFDDRLIAKKYLK